MSRRLPDRMYCKHHVSSILCLILAVPAAPAAELPVRSVVLYKHGVGYFERGGTLNSGDSARLDFKTDEMNDVLKSLTISDGGGAVKAVRYDSNIPLERKLSEFPVRITPGQPMSAVLDQLKGARIEMEFGPQKVTGEIVSARLTPGDKERSERELLTILMDSGELRNVDLSAASAIRFPDPKVQTLFKDYLAALTGSRSRDKRSVYIDSTDTKSREVRASYIIPMPAWKTGYRLLFASSGQPTLEGWAIVDNTTGDDWNDIHISLVSGKPISFVSELYSPKYVQRSSAELPEDQAIAPTLYSGAIGGLPTATPPPGAPRAMAKGGGGGNSASLEVSAASPLLAENRAFSRPAQPSSVRLDGSARELADLFEYSIRNPVTVKKNESAMLPFLQQKVEARKVIIYSDQSKSNPLNAAELTNSSGRTLDGGPITVYDDGAYAGEALVETVKDQDKRFISYGVDLGTRIATTLGSETSNIRELHAHNGLLITRSAVVQKKAYGILNVDNRPKTLIIEHPVRPNYHLIDTAKPMETARDVYRFEIKLPAKGSVDFPVTEEYVYDQQTAVSSLSPDSLLLYVRNKILSDAARRQLQQVADVKDQIVALDNEKRKLDSEVQNLTRDEDRNRQNISSLSAVSGQQQTVQDYARKLSEQEAQIAKARERQAAIDAQRLQFQNQLNALIARLEF